MANFMTVDYKTKDSQNRIVIRNCEEFDILAEIESETETEIRLKNCSVRWGNTYLKISKKFENRIAILFSYGIVNYDDFILRIKQNLMTTKNIIFTDFYTNDDYCQEIEPEVLV